MSDRIPLLLQTAPPQDRWQRGLTDLRISVVDRCNFRCPYCLPEDQYPEHHPFLDKRERLSFEEIERLARVFAGLGVRKIRLTGGEPLLRKHIERLVEMLAGLRTPEGAPLDLTLTTNGSLLARKAKALKDAGLQRITVSLDAMDDAIFRRMNDVDFPVAEVLEGIAAAQAAGLAPIKVNMVVKRSVNDHEVLPMARHFHGTGIALRFIEYMDVGATNGWRMDEVLPSRELLARLQTEFTLKPLGASTLGETAERWQHIDGGGEIGLISSVTQAFCGDCNRARLSTEGKLYLCLFAHAGHDLRGLLRGGAQDEDIAGTLAAIWAGRKDRYSQLRASGATVPGEVRKVEMHYIGG